MARSEDILYERYRGGDRDALAELYERLAAGLFRYGLYLSGNRAAAEEAAHEAFLQLMQPATTFDSGRGSVEAYLYGVVRNQVRVAARKTAPGIEGDHASSEDVAGALIDDEASVRLHQAIRQLPVAYRDAVVLCDIEERSYEDAAELMRCPVGTVRSRLYRARRLLAAKLATQRSMG